MIIANRSFTNSPEETVDELERRYDKSAENLLTDFKAYVTQGVLPAPAPHAYSYPALRITHRSGTIVPPHAFAFGTFEADGVFETDIAQPALFRQYLTKQISLLYKRHGDTLTIEVGQSPHNIPYPYVLGSADYLDTDVISPAQLARLFPTPQLSHVTDEIANGIFTPEEVSAATKPLSLFTALRTDYSLQRLKHYTGTDPKDFQQFVLFTNYNRYMDEFVSLGLQRLRDTDLYDELVAPGGIRVDANSKEAIKTVMSSPTQLSQMPAYHLKAPGNQGITLVNIGVGPSNAKTITDHLAVLRSQCWIMVGHCGGLRYSQRLGDYVLAHAYLRRDHVLDDDLPPDIPIPPIAEVQLALTAAARKVTGDSSEDLRRRLRTGTVVTHDNRNWEMSYTSESKTLSYARAIAIDMESATVAANGYRFRVPYGTLLCVSDKPLHNEIKLPGAANSFYRRAVGEHMKIGVDAMESFRSEGAQSLHSRKLRSFNEPAFR